MRGDDPKQGANWSYISPEARVPKEHPLRAIRTMVERALAELDPVFRRMYSPIGRPSIPPELLLRALVLQLLYSVRSERLLMEQLDHDMLFRWFVGLNADDPIWDVSVFTKNRERLLKGDVAQRFFAAVLRQANEADLLSDEHFSVDGTLIEAWASQQSFTPKDAPTGKDGTPGGAGDFKGQRRSNETHQSTTDPDARLYRKGSGQEAKLCYLGHVLLENRHGLAVGGILTQAGGTAEREAALALITQVPRAAHVTLGCDKAYDSADFVAHARAAGVTPHVSQNTTHRRSAIDGRTTRHRGYEVSAFKRRLAEGVWGWCKTVGLLRKTRHRGTPRVGWVFTFTLAVYDLVRMRKLIAVTA
ncbi:MAG TPA: IS5 family transposase [Chloroflexi bacterium]|jgi:transposase|nr:IS5 family transposase [Chloroflexota bacterium]HAL26464.1 IS5 family transposase [Chloroflexota bacterium]